MGAADYIVKPLLPTELAAKIRADLRRRAVPGLVEPSEFYLLRDLTMAYAGRPVELTGIEYQMLTELSVNARPALTNVRPLQRVWHLEVGSNVKRLSRKLWGTTLATPSTVLTSLASAIGCRRGRRLILLRDDGTPHELCRPTTGWLQGHRPGVPQSYVSVVYCEC